MGINSSNHALETHFSQTNPPTVPVPPASGRFAGTKVESGGSISRSIPAMKARNIGYTCLAFVSKAFSSDRSSYFTYRAKYEEKKINLQELNKGRSIFGNALQARAINIVSKQSYSEFKQAKARANAMSKASASRDENFIQKGGICKGISLDLADRYVNKKENFSEIMGSLSGGGTIEAEINQTVYERNSENLTAHSFVNHFFESVRSDQGSLLDSTFSSVNRNSTLTLFNITTETNLKDELKSKKREAVVKKILDNNNLSNFVFSKETPPENAQIILLGVLMHKANYAPEWMGSDASGSIDYPQLFEDLKIEIDHIYKEANENLDKKFEAAIAKTPEKKAELENEKQKMMGEIAQKRSELLKEAKIVQASRAEGIPKEVKDPEMGLLKDLKTNFLLKQGHYVADQRSLTLKSMTHVMGESSSFVSDKAYLRNLDKLEPGFYNISLSTSGGGHSISLIIRDEKDAESGFKGGIIDPNVGSITFKDMEEAKATMERLLSLYKPIPLSLNSKMEIPHHNLRILQCIPKSMSENPQATSST